MPSQKPTLNQADINLLKETFVTKEYLSKELKPIKHGLKKINKDLVIIINSFDREYLGHERRVQRIENHLNLPRITD